MFSQRRRVRMVVVLWHIVLLASLKAFIMNVVAVETCTNDKTYFSLIFRDIATRQHFPESVPFNTQSVTLIGKDFLDNSFPNDVFLHPSWRNISELTITGFERVEFIQKPFLAGLYGLKCLSISLCIRIQHIHPEVLGSTPNLQSLYLDENFSLTFSATERAITGKVRRLNFLSLKSLQRYNSSSVLGKEFDSALAGKNVTFLDISSSNVVEIDYTVLANTFSNLRFLNLSYTKIAITENSTIDIQRITSHLEVLDVSGCPHFMGASNKMSWFSQYSNYLCSVFQVNYYISRNMIRPYQAYNVLLDLSACNTTKVSVWDLSNSAVRILNMTNNGPFVIHSMRKLDLSKNELEFVSPSFLSVFPSLIILNLADNHLHKMHSTDLRNLFHRNKYLKILSFRSNQLQFIPYDLFFPIEDLRVLDVGDNMLTTFDFGLSRNLNIKLLDLSFNGLANFSSDAFNILEDIFHLQMKRNESSKDLYDENFLIQSFEESNISKRYRYGYSLENNLGILIPTIPFHLTIHLFGNPLSYVNCKWHLEWAASTSKTITIDNNSSNCDIKEQNLLSDSAGYVFIIVIAFACCTCTCTCTCCVCCVCCKRSTKTNTKRLRNYFQTHNRKYKNVVFVPYCSRDSDIVEGDILPMVINYFKENLAIEENIVCTGKENFIPGLRIINEIHRCLDESLVVVPVITRSFLQSSWSLEELVVASEKGKKTVILLEEQTDVSDATETVKNLVARYTRATWSRKEGRFVIRPTWNVICQSLINHSGTTLLKETKQKADKACNQLPAFGETVM
ncbi:hypothetical protein CHS0354_003724 [Potamilus streckersoni]|nr:hypothetical protein CHS0354_003724 [Potamilus streckersoni]